MFRNFFAMINGWNSLCSVFGGTIPGTFLNQVRNRVGEFETASVAEFIDAVENGDEKSNFNEATHVTAFCGTEADVRVAELSIWGLFCCRRHSHLQGNDEDEEFVAEYFADDDPNAINLSTTSPSRNISSNERRSRFL